MRPSAVLFDAGNTLVFLDYARLAHAVGERLGMPLSEADLRRHASVAALSMEDRRLSDTERGGRYLMTLFTRAGVPADRMGELRDVLLALHQEHHLWGTHDAATADALQRLQDAGFRLAVISNSDGRAASTLALNGLLGYFEFVIDSGEVGIEKPDPRIFALALERMQVTPADALYVGDLYEVDILGARAAGIPAVLVDADRAHVGTDVPVVSSVAELADQLIAAPAA